MRKIVLLTTLSFLLACISTQTAAQQVSLEVDGTALYNGDGGDCNGSADNRWRTRVSSTSSAWYNWDYNCDNCGGGWGFSSNYGWMGPVNVPTFQNLWVDLDAWETDGAVCGGDDYVCGGYGRVFDQPMRNYNSGCWQNNFESGRNCGGNWWSVRYNWVYFYVSPSPGSINGDQTICTGGDPTILGNAADATEGGSTGHLTRGGYQWQVLNNCSGGWADIAGATGSTYDPPGGETISKCYRRRSRHASANNCASFAETFTNTVTVTVVPDPVSPTINPTPAAGNYCKGQNLSATFNAGSGGTGTITDSYEISTNGGGSYAAYTPGTSIATTGFANGTTIIIRTRRTASAAFCDNGAYNSVSWTVWDDPTQQTINPNIANGTTVCQGQGILANFSGGAGGTGTVTDVYQFSTNSGSSFSAYTAGTTISTAGLSGGSVVQIRTQRTATAGGCDNSPWTTFTWGVVADPASQSITPNVASGSTVCAGQDISATFSGGSGGTGTVTDVYEFSINGGGSYSAYTPGSAINTTSLGGQQVRIRTYRTATGNDCNTSVANEISVNIVADPVAQTINPNVANGTTICAGQSISATFSGGSGGTGSITNEYEFSTNGGSSFSAYTPGNSISSASSAGSSIQVRTRRSANGAGCTTSAWSTFNWPVVAQPTAGTITPNVANGTTICAGQNISATISAGAGGTGTVQDVNEFSTNGGTTWNGYTPGNNISTSLLAGQTIMIRTYRTATGSGCSTSSITTMSWPVVADPVAQTINPNFADGSTVCAGQGISATFSGGSGGTGTITDSYEFSTNGGSSYAAYTPGNTISTTGLSGTGIVRIRTRRSATGLDCNTSNYNTISINVNPDPVAQTINPNIAASSTVCQGANLSAFFTGGSGGTGTITDTYEYSTNSGGSWSAYTPADPISTVGLTGANVVQIRTRRTATGSGCDASAYNTVAWSVVIDPVSPTIVPNLPGGTTVCRGQDLSATFNPGSGGAGTVTDVYEYQIDGGIWTAYTPGTPISTIVLSGNNVVRIRTNRTATASGCDASAYNQVTWNVALDPTSQVITPNVTTGTTVCQGQNISATFSGGSGGTGTVTDVYEYSINGGSTWLAYTPGNNISTASVTGTNVVQIRTYRTATGLACNNSTPTVVQYSVVTDPVAQTITPNVANGSTVCQGQIISATFSGGSGGTGVVVQDQYQFSTDGGSTWNAYGNGNQIGTTGLSGTNVVQIRTRRVANGLGCDDSPYTTVSFSVVPDPVSQTINPNLASGTTVCQGQNLSATFSGGSGGTGTVTDVYEFSTDGGSSWNGYTPGNNISTTGLTGTSVVQVRTRRVASGADCNTPAYNTVTWNVVADPVAQNITPSVPNGSSVCQGTDISATFSGGSGGTGTITDIYEFSTNGGGSWSVYTPGSPIATNALSGASVVQIRTRRTATGNDCNTSANNTVTFNVDPNPSAPTGIFNQVRCGTGTVTFTANNPGAGFTVEWSLNGTTAINSGTSYVYNVTSGNVDDVYARVINTTTGCVSSWVLYTATANVIPAVPTGLADQEICGPGTVTFNANDPGSPLINQWSTDGVNHNGGAGLTYNINLAEGQVTPLYARTFNTTTNCFSNWVQVDAISHAYPVPAITSNSPICFATNLSLNSPAGYVDYDWSGPNGFTSAVQNPSIIAASTAATGTYTLYVEDIYGCIGSNTYNAIVSTCGTYTWEGDNSQDWNTPGNWNSNLVPDILNSVIIPDVANDPRVLAGGNNGSCKNVNIAAYATLTIDIGKTVTVGGNWVGNQTQVSGSGNLVFGGTAPQTITGGGQFDNVMIDNAAGVTITAGPLNQMKFKQSLNLKSGTFFGNNNIYIPSTATQTGYINNFTSGYTGTINGNITMERSNPGNTGFRYISMPINNPSISEISEISLIGTNMGQVIPLASCSPSNVAQNSAYGNVMEWHEDGPFMVPGCRQSGWYVRSAGSLENFRGYLALMYGGQTVVVTGTPNLTSQTYATPLANTNSTGDGWHLMGNPYPSPVQWTGVAGFGDMNLFNVSGIYTGTYATYAPVQNKIIASMQGFFVRRLAPAPLSFGLPNSSRRAVSNISYLSSANWYNHLLEIDVTGNGFGDHSTVYFNNGATADYESYFDARKMDGRVDQPMIYTHLPNGNDQLGVNGLGNLDQTYAVPLVMKPGQNGEFTFTFNEVGTFPATSMVYLQDLQAGTLTDLRANAQYIFNADVNDNPERFLIRFEPPVSANIADATCDASGSITVTQPGNTVWSSYELRDNNNVVHATGNNFSGSVVFNNLAPQEYILKLTHPSGYVAEEYYTVNGSANAVTATVSASATTAQVDQVVTFTANANNAIEYVWNFGDGVELTTTAASVTHSYSTEGTYNTTVTARNNNCQATASSTVNVNNVATGLNNTTADNLTINGFGSQISVEFNSWGGSKADIFVFNALGQRVKSFTGVSTMNGRQLLNVDVKPGYYFIQVVSNGNVSGKKVYLGSN